MVLDSTSHALTSSFSFPDASTMDVVIAMRYAQAAEVTTLRAAKVARQLALDFDNNKFTTTRISRHPEQIVNHTFTPVSMSVTL